MKGLAEKRKALGLTLKQMAENLGIAFKTYCNYEYGWREPNLETLKRIAEYLNCSVDEIL